MPQKAQSPDVVEINHNCSKCGKAHKIYAKLKADPNIDRDFQKRGYTPFPKDNKLKCECRFEIDIGGIRNEIELKTGVKVVD